MSEPVSLETIKVHLRLDPDDTGEDAYLAGLITAARRSCELRIQRSVIGASLIKVLDAFPAASFAVPAIGFTLPLEAAQPDASVIELPGGTVAAIGSVTYIDASGLTQLIDAAEYTAELTQAPARLAPVTRWPTAGTQPGAVRIAYTVSPLSPDDLACVCQAMLLLVGHWYVNRETVVSDVRGIPSELQQTLTWILEPLKQWPTS